MLLSWLLGFQNSFLTPHAPRYRNFTKWKKKQLFRWEKCCALSKNAKETRVWIWDPFPYDNMFIIITMQSYISEVC